MIRPRRIPSPALALVLVAGAIVLAGCGSSAPRSPGGAADPTTTAAAATTPRAHPQAVEPVAGARAPSTTASSDPVGDVNAHAPSLSVVKRELVRLNMCGGATSSAQAAPVVRTSAPGFTADPGTQQTEGELPVITAALNALGKALRVTIYGISGYRTPAHSVAVGGYADDPHTQGLAEDIGVNSLLRSSAAQITEADLARFGLYRPFDPSDDPGNTEVNHVQLIPSGGAPSVAVAEATWDPDPSCS